MARKPSKRVVLNRAALDQVHLALADGVMEIGRTIVETADPPDSPLEPYPTGEGLPLQGGVLVYAGGKVDGWHQRGGQPKKPRAARTPEGIVTGIVGFGFPGRFAEIHNGQPFLSPALDAVIPHIPEILRSTVKGRLR